MSGKVVGLGAWCDYVTRNDEAIPLASSGLSFDVQEFAVLADVRRRVLHRERGSTTWLRSTEQSRPTDPWSDLTAESIEPGVRTTVLPDDDTEDEDPWDWLASLLRRHGVEVPIEQLRRVPYTVEFSERLSQRLQSSSDQAACDA